MDFSNRLSTVIQEQVLEKQPEQAKEDLLLLATTLQDQVAELETKAADARKQLAHTIEQLNTNLGMAVRKRQPKMQISHRNGTCGCGFRSRDLICKPDLKQKTWSIDGQLGRGFRKAHPKALALSGDVEPLADAIVNYFRRYYRSLY